MLIINPYSFGFNPLSISSLIAWYDPDYVTQSSGVASQTNRAGSSYAITGPVAPNRPAFSSTLIWGASNGITFDGAGSGNGDYLTIGDDIVLTGDFHITMLRQTQGTTGVIFSKKGGTAAIYQSSYKATSINNDANSGAVFFSGQGGAGSEANVHAVYDGHPIIETYERVGSTITRYINDVVDSTATLSGTITFNRIGASVDNSDIVSSTAGSTPFLGSLFDVFICNDSLTTAERKNLSLYIRNKRNVCKYTIVASPASRCRGDGASSADPSKSTVAQLLTLLKAAGYYGWTAYNDGISGMTALNADTRNASSSGTKGIDLKDWYTDLSKPILLSTDIGGNDISGVSDNSDTVISRVTTWITGRKASNAYRNIIIMAGEVGINTTYTNTGIAYNGKMRTAMLAGGSMKLAGADDYVELANNPNGRYDSDGDYNNTTYYQTDKTHLTAAGYADAAAQCYTTVLPYVQAAMGL